MVNKVNNFGQLFRQKEIKAQLSQKKADEESIDFWRERCANEQYKVFVIDEKKAIKVKHHKNWRTPGKCGEGVQNTRESWSFTMTPANTGELQEILVKHQ